MHFRRQAFTLVELILVIAITGTIAAVAVPRYAASLTRYRVNMASQRIVDELNHARETALSSSSSVTINLKPKRDEIRIIGAGSLTHPSSNESLVKYNEAPYQVDVEIKLSDGSMASTQVDFEFDGFGQANKDLTIIVSAGNLQREVEISTTNPKVTRP